MAKYKYTRYLERVDLDVFDCEYSPGDDVPHSGIYKCKVCGNEAACNEGDPFPPQNHHQHPSSQQIRWKLIVTTS